MFIDLSWTDLNSVATTLKIYRGDAPLDRANLPASPIATLTNGETSYRDESNIVLGKTYYYVFVTSTANDTVVSDNYTITAVTRRGPGPQNLLQGDNNLGYFGSMQSGEFINANDLVAKTTLTTFATTMGIINPFPLWHKFVRNNKVIIVPEGPIGNSLSWNQLYAAGMVFGTDDTGPTAGTITGNTPTKQDTKVTIGSDTFRIRLMRGMSEGPITQYETVFLSVNEFNDLVYPMAHPVPPDQRLNNIYLNGQKLYQLLGVGGATVYTLVQEAGSATAVNLRGQATSSDDFTTDTTSSLAYRNTATAPAVSNNYAWFPVLELIEG